MPLMNTALQTLSEMAILENNVTIPKKASSNLIEEFMEDLDQIPSLNLSETIVPANMVNLHNSKRYGLLIEMEDLSRYMITNNIRAFDEAITNILHANNEYNTPYMHVKIIIDEASILDEIANLGQNLPHDNWGENPPKGLGKPDITTDFKNFDRYRKIANSKELMDILTGRYGLRLVKKNYRQIGLLASTEHDNGESLMEDVDIKPKSNDRILHEKDPESKNIEKESEEQNTVDGKLNNKIQEETDPYQNYLNYLKDVAKGKYDAELAD